MTSSEPEEGVPAPRRERRAAGEQRRYNRRAPASEAPPPYYETFERIALALERIEKLLASRVIDLAGPEQRETAPKARSSADK